MRYKIPNFLSRFFMAAGPKDADSAGFITPQNTAEELLLMAAGAIPEFPVVWVFSGTTVTGFLHPITGATITFPNAGIPSYLLAPGPIGTTTPAVVKTSNLQATYTDSSGTPGNATNNSPRGRAAFAAAGSTVTITSSLVTATSSVHVQLGGSDATLTSVRVTAAAGSFTVTGNAAATATTVFYFLVIN